MGKRTGSTSIGNGLNAKNPSISRLAFLLAGLLIAVTSSSLLFVGHVASTASDYQTIQSEKARLQTAINNRLNMVVSEQLTIARSDETVRELVQNFNVNFIQNRVSKLWKNYRFNRTFIVTADDQIRVESFEDYTHITNTALADTPSLMPLVARTRALFEINRVRVPGGYGHRSLRGLQTEDYATTGFAKIDGRVAMVSAVPIIPDNHTIPLQSPQATILISAIFVDGGLLKDLNGDMSSLGMNVLSEIGGSLELDALNFKPDVSAKDGLPKWDVQNINGDHLGVFAWTSSSQGTSIWPTVIPVVLLLSLALSILAFGIAWKIGRLTKTLQNSERNNKFLAHHDTLSGLANRLLINTEMAKAMEQVHAHPFALMHCDLDRFKSVNDTLGHAAGDEVIKTVADRLQQVIGADGLVGRIGGDEFVVLYHRSVLKDDLKNSALKLISSINDPVTLNDGREACVGLSVGIAIAPADGTTQEALFAVSDAALYKSKEEGRGRVAFAGDNRVYQPADITKLAAPLLPLKEESNAA